MYRLQTTPVKSSWKSVWAFLKGSGAFAGCLTAAAVVACGRAFLSVTTSTLSGWTALFFAALFMGMAVANLRSKFPFAGTQQMLAFILGCITSCCALFTLEYEQGSLSGILLAMSGVLLLASLAGIRPTNRSPELKQDRLLLNWTLRVDDLMKYELTPELRAGLANLIDTLWRSPPDPADFIPAQNDRAELLLCDLEQRVRLGTITEAMKIIATLARCLEERSLVLKSHVEIQYRDVSISSLLPGSSPSSKRKGS